MDFLELWKNYPVLWHQTPTPKDKVYAAAVTELTNKINKMRNLTITDAGMKLTLSRIRIWFRDHKYTEEHHPNVKREYYENVKRVYYKKCMEFLSKQEIRSLKCDECNCFFGSEEQLREHIDKVHKTYCELCQKNYANAKKYRKHLYIHEPPKFKCDTCGKTYNRFTNYQEHLRAHRNERNYVCDTCGKKFVRQKNLNDHKKLRHPNKDNFLKRPPCAICGTDFKDWSALSMHRKQHHLVLEGTIEELMSRAKHTVREHKKHTFIVDPVTKQRRTVCQICGNTYARHGGLHVHMVKEHGYVRPTERLKAALQTHSNIVNLNTEKIDEVDGNIKRRDSEELEIVEEIIEADDEGDLIYEADDYDENVDGDDYEFLIEDDMEFLES